jgi:hypothetical protein
MKVKQIGGTVYGAELTVKERKAMDIEIKRQIAAMEREHANALDALVLYALHVHLGWGKTRLRRFYEAFTKEHNRLIEYYEMPDDNAWLATEKLKEIGVDVAAWNEEKE